ncbi:MAG: dihydropteroate synthase [Flavobacteriales bacterium]|nr:MAG: dihydropteroate synthase [Flavobacteriales bacterium]
MSAKDTHFSNKTTLNCNGQLLFLDEPLVMGILNVTLDSFFDGGKHQTEQQILQHTENMLNEGADIIDIGAYSTRPNADEVSEEEERKRLISAIKTVHKHFPGAIISADTFRSQIAKEAIESGAAIINDISGGQFDDKMFETVAQLHVPYVLMHIKGKPQTMQQNPIYEDVVKEISMYFAEKINQLRLLGINDIILDVGFGFGKTLEHNYELMNKLNHFKIFGLPLLAGISRKSMINKILGTIPETALNGTTVLNTFALLKEAKILRVHNVKQAVETVKLISQFTN